MLYLKSINMQRNHTVVSPISDHYQVHAPGSDLFDYMSKEGEVDHLKHMGVITFDSDEERTSRRVLSLSMNHYIVHENGSTFQKI